MNARIRLNPLALFIPTISQNKLTGPLLPELGAAWTVMEELSLSANALQGPLPKEWSKMGRRLRLLYL